MHGKNYCSKFSTLLVVHVSINEGWVLQYQGTEVVALVVVNARVVSNKLLPGAEVTRKQSNLH